MKIKNINKTLLKLYLVIVTSVLLGGCEATQSGHKEVRTSNQNGEASAITLYSDNAPTEKVYSDISSDVAVFNVPDVFYILGEVEKAQARVTAFFQDEIKKIIDLEKRMQKLIDKIKQLEGNGENEKVAIAKERLRKLTAEYREKAPVLQRSIEIKAEEERNNVLKRIDAARKEVMKVLGISQYVLANEYSGAGGVDITDNIVALMTEENDK